MAVKAGIKIISCLFLAVFAMSMPMSGWGVRQQAIQRDILAAVGGRVSLEEMERVIASLGEVGCVAVDSENQIDMAGAGKAMDFVRAVDAGEEAGLTIIEVLYTGGFRQYELSAKEGHVDVVRRYYQYGQNGNPEERDVASYPAGSWQYTEEGYLLFEGNYASKESYVLTLSENVEHVAFRVQPLDRACREFNRKYIRPVGYRHNNMFLVDWDETDFGDLNFYDLFDALYPLRFGRAVPYVMGDDLASDVVYRIPKGEFENVVMPYFKIDGPVLQAKTDYLPEDQVYQYKPRGFRNAEYPDIPYPEVVSYREKEGGIVELAVNAVYPNDNTSKAFSHIVEIRLLDGGGFQYVSNQVVFPEGEIEAWWHGGR